MKWEQLLSRERFGDDGGRAPVDGRSEFQVDEDRIVFSQHFRRLQDKTQVHPLSENDHVRRRLTHSIEVATVGRSLGTLAAPVMLASLRGAVRLTPHDVGDILHAASLAHDIGNPPFGHFGEQAIGQWFSEHQDELTKKFALNLTEEQWGDLTAFDGNPHGFFILTSKELHKGRPGMQLTAATLGAFLKYPRGATHPTGSAESGKPRAQKHGYFQCNKPEMEWVAETLGLLPDAVNGVWCRSPLTYLLEAADDTCYAIADLEDGVELNVITYPEVRDLLIGLVSEQSKYRELSGPSSRTMMEALRGDVIGTLVREIATEFQNHAEELLAGKFRDKLLDKIPHRAVVAAAKDLAKTRVFRHQRKVRIEIAAYQILGGLLDELVPPALANLCGKPTDKGKRILALLGNSAPTGQGAYEVLLQVTSYIAAMTDTYAHRTYLNLKGISFSD